MSKIKNKIGSFVASVAEKAVLGYFSNIKKGIVSFLEHLPAGTAKLYFAYTLVLFLVVMAASGLIVVTAGLIMVLVSLLASSVDKVLVAGILLSVTGFLYLSCGILLIKGVGSIIKSALTDTTKEIVKKIQ